MLRNRSTACRPLTFLATGLLALLLTGCCMFSRPGRPKIDIPVTYEGREEICLYNLETMLDAKQEWADETCAGIGSLSPSSEVLAHTYRRRYEYGRRAPWDDDTQYKQVNVFLCPSGGEYIIGTVGERPKCTYHGDLLMKYDLKTKMRHVH